MARPGQVPEPSAGADAGYGATAQLRRVDRAGSPAGGAGAQAVRPNGRPPADVTDPEDDADTELNDGYDSALFAPTNRPDVPVTNGAPFGEGANYVPLPSEDDFTFMQRVANDLDSGPQSGQLREFISKIRLGG